MNSESSLAQDLCARLCHDLVGPLGTIGGAMSLLGEDPEAAGLAQDAVAEMRRRLSYWRAACGAGTGPLALSEIATLLDGMLAGGRARFDLGAMPRDRVLPAPVAQLLLVAAMLAGEAVSRGGVVHLGPGAAAEALVLRPEGRVVAWAPGVAAALGGDASAGPRGILATMLRVLAEGAGWRAALRAEGEAMVLRLDPRG